MKYVQKTRQRVIAINLAREWMEAVYQLRDTNRTRWAWVKDSCRLKINPLVDDSWNVDTCIDDMWVTTWFYALQRLSTGGQTYFALTGPFLTWITFSGGITQADLNFSLCQQSWYRDDCSPWQSGSIIDGQYFRQIEWLWLYLKDTNESIACLNGSDTCSTSRAKEFRFCSEVAYVGGGTGDVRFCGVITNFKGESSEN
jgi:hypothetical protein